MLAEQRKGANADALLDAVILDGRRPAGHLHWQCAMGLISTPEWVDSTLLDGQPSSAACSPHGAVSPIHDASHTHPHIHAPTHCQGCKIALSAPLGKRGGQTTAAANLTGPVRAARARTRVGVAHHLHPLLRSLPQPHQPDTLTTPRHVPTPSPSFPRAPVPVPVYTCRRIHHRNSEARQS